MTWKDTELSYRRSAVENASPVGLVVILYDVLVRDLKSSIEAMHSRDIEKRSKELKHALLVLQQLEGSLDMEHGGEAARNLASFYSVMRAKILDAQYENSPEILHRQVELVLDVRKAWGQVDPNRRTVDQPAGDPSQVSSPERKAPSTDEREAANWSA